MGVQATGRRGQPVRLLRIGAVARAALRPHGLPHGLSHGLPREPMATLGLRLVASALLLFLAALCSLATPRIPGTARPPNALFLLCGITLLTACVTIPLRRGLVRDAVSALSLPHPLYPLYLATVALSGTTGAVLLAFVASLLYGAPEFVELAGREVRAWRFARLDLAQLAVVARQAAGAAVTTLIAGSVYASLPLVLKPAMGGLNGRLVASVVATLVMLAGIVVTRTLDARTLDARTLDAHTLDAHEATPHRSWAAAGLAFLRSPAFGYQVVLLSIGPLLPFVALLDNFRSELAWILFLIPLSAIYSLAILGVRLRQRTDQLQASVAALTASQQREVELVGYAALVTRAQEEERRRLARDLHDDTAQALVALARGLDALAARRAGEGALSGRDRAFVDELGVLAKRSVESIRRACQNLRPSVLDDLGLAAALDSLVTFVASSDLAPSTRCVYLPVGTSVPACAPEIEVTIYRIAQEALSNAVRHAHASTVEVHFGCKDDVLYLRVRDDGRGFVPGAAALRDGIYRGEAHLGLLGMRERAALIGAALRVESAPGAGTLVELRLPLHRARVA